MTHTGRPSRGPARVLLLAVPALLAPVLLAGCGSTPSTAVQPAAASAAGQSGMPGMPGTSRTATPPAAGGPPKVAAMVCEGQVARDVAQVLQLDGPAPTTTTWADPVFTCTYQLPEGPMVLTVHVAPDAQGAGAVLDADRTRRGETTGLAGLGERAFSTPGGVTEVLRESAVLTVDTTALPVVFGPQDQHRTDLADEIASDVLGCWVEHA